MRTDGQGGILATLAERRAYLVLAALVVLLDQASKLAVVRHVALGETVTVVPRVLTLTHSLNPGGVWGVLRDAPESLRLVVFLALPLLITMLAAWYSLRSPPGARVRQAAIALVVGGALGNLVDRVRLHHVVDFIRVHLGSYTWPDFNVADSAICVGVAVLVVTSFLEQPDEEEGA